MKKIKYIVVHSSDNEEHKIEIKDKFSRTANADYASKKMVNASGNAHSWTTEQLRNVLGPFTPTHNETSGDMAYTANMAYADFYPAVLDTVDKCITYAKLVASDPDGYEGMEFMRWTSDAIGKSLTLNWEDFI